MGLAAAQGEESGDARGLTMPSSTGSSSCGSSPLLVISAWSLRDARKSASRSRVSGA